jgi:catalase
MRLHEQEVVTPFEERYATDLLARLKKQLIEEHPSGIMPRDAHPKMHGLVEAEFTVLGDLSESHKIGIFAQAKTYKTWVRFSNANGISQPDLKRDIRGIAIKLTQVQGEKLNITSNGSESDCADDRYG